MKIVAVILLTAVFGLVQAQETINTDSTSRSTVDSTSRSFNQNETTVRSPPPSAISPTITVINNDLCTVGVSGAVQTQILGISGGSTVRDMNCERLKLSKVLYDSGLKVAAVSLLCQDERVFNAMKMAGTPCPIDGKIGAEAALVWEGNPERAPGYNKENSNSTQNFWKILGTGLFFLLLL